jgi:hypothetical protein
LLPWEVAELPYDIYAYWSGVMSTYHAQRELSTVARAGTGRGR